MFDNFNIPVNFSFAPVVNIIITNHYTSPKQKANVMRIQFEIKETLAGIIDQLLHSDFWITEVEEVSSNKRIIRIRDFAYPQEAVAEVTDNEIVFHTAWSNFTYHIYEIDGTCWCEYSGAYRGLLEQKLLPILTPKETFLDQPVSSSLLGENIHKPLREYAMDNLKLKKFRQQMFGDIGFSVNDHPKKVYDAFIKEDYIPEIKES